MTEMLFNPFPTFSLSADGFKQGERCAAIGPGKLVLSMIVFCCVFLSAVVMASDPDQGFERGNYYYVQEKFEHAIEHYHRFIKENPNHPERGLAQFLIGKCYRHLGLNEKAEEAFQAIQTTDQDSIWIDDGILNEAEMKAEQADPNSIREAILAYNSIVHNYQGGNCYLPALFGLGKVHFKLGQWKDSEKAFLQILNLSPHDDLAVEVRLALGDFYRNRANDLFNPEQAIMHYQQILEKFPKTASLPSIYLAIGNTLRELGKADEAIATYQKIVQQFPDSLQSPLAQSMIGLCYEDRNEISKSLDAYGAVKKYSAPQVLKDTVSSRARKINRLLKESMHLEADQINYDASKGKAEYSHDVTIYWNDCIISCDRAIAYLKKTYIRALGNVVCQSRRDLKLQCDSFLFFPKQYEANLYGNARILAIDPSTGEERVIVQGQKISYNFSTDTYTLE